MRTKIVLLLKIGLLIGVAAIALILFAGNNNVVSLVRLHGEVGAAQASLEKAKETADSLNLTISRLKSDTAYIERVARERLGMAKKGEKIYKFSGDK